MSLAGRPTRKLSSLDLSCWEVGTKEATWVDQRTGRAVPLLRLPASGLASPSVPSALRPLAHAHVSLPRGVQCGRSATRPSLPRRRALGTQARTGPPAWSRLTGAGGFARLSVRTERFPCPLPPRRFAEAEGSREPGFVFSVCSVWRRLVKAAASPSKVWVALSCLWGALSIFSVMELPQKPCAVSPQFSGGEASPQIS